MFRFDTSFRYQQVMTTFNVAGDATAATPRSLCWPRSRKIIKLESDYHDLRDAMPHARGACAPIAATDVQPAVGRRGGNCAAWSAINTQHILVILALISILEIVTGHRLLTACKLQLEVRLQTRRSESRASGACRQLFHSRLTSSDRCLIVPHGRSRHTTTLHASVILRAMQHTCITDSRKMGAKKKSEVCGVIRNSGVF